MKKIILFTLGVIVLLLPVVTLAATVRGGPTYTVPAEQSIEGSLYAGGGTVTIVGTVNGDAVVAGGTITHSGAVTKDLLIAGGTITITGSVGEDVRVAGGQISITTTIPGDLVVAGGTVVLEEGVIVNGDVLAAGGAVTINGEVKGMVTGTGGDFVLNGPIGGDVDLAVGQLTLMSKARLAGDLHYRSPVEATIADGATVAGETTFEQKRQAWFGRLAFGFAGAGIIGWLIGLVTLAVAAVFLSIVFKNFTAAVVADAVAKPWWRLLVGFGVLIGGPIAAVILFVSVIGALVGVLLLAVYFSLLIGAAIYAGIILGSWVFKLFTKDAAPRSDWPVAVVGVVVFELIALLPLAAMIFYVMALGSLFVTKLRFFQTKS